MQRDRGRAIRWLRSIVAICVGVAVAAGLERYVGLPIFEALQHMFVPEVDSVFRPEPTHPLVYWAASLAAIGSCFMVGGLVAAVAAPSQRILHAIAVGLAVGAFVLATEVRPAGTSTSTSLPAIVVEVVAVTTVAAALGGLVGRWAVSRLAKPTAR